MKLSTTYEGVIVWPCTRRTVRTTTSPATSLNYIARCDLFAQTPKMWFVILQPASANAAHKPGNHHAPILPWPMSFLPWPNLSSPTV
jgi:hypothetical protein